MEMRRTDIVTLPGSSFQDIHKRVFTFLCHHAAPQALTVAATRRQRAALTAHVFAVELLLYTRREVFLEMSQADHG